MQCFSLAWIGFAVSGGSYKFALCYFTGETSSDDKGQALVRLHRDISLSTQACDDQLSEKVTCHCKALILKQINNSPVISSPREIKWNAFVGA